MRKSNEHDFKPVCDTCGTADVVLTGAEVVWHIGKQEWELVEQPQDPDVVYCMSCGNATDLRWHQIEWARDEHNGFVEVTA